MAELVGTDDVKYTASPQLHSSMQLCYRVEPHPNDKPGWFRFDLRLDEWPIPLIDDHVRMFYTFIGRPYPTGNMWRTISEHMDSSKSSVSGPSGAVGLKLRNNSNNHDSSTDSSSMAVGVRQTGKAIETCAEPLAVEGSDKAKGKETYAVGNGEEGVVADGRAFHAGQYGFRSLVAFGADLIYSRRFQRPGRSRRGRR